MARPRRLGLSVSLVPRCHCEPLAPKASSVCVTRAKHQAGRKNSARETLLVAFPLLHAGCRCARAHVRGAAASALDLCPPRGSSSVQTGTKIGVCVIYLTKRMLKRFEMCTRTLILIVLFVCLSCISPVLLLSFANRLSPSSGPYRSVRILCSGSPSP